MSAERIAKVLDGRIFAGRQLNERQVEEIASVLAPLNVAAQAEALREAAGTLDKIGDGELDIVLTSNWLRTRAAAMDPEGRALVAAIHDRKAKQ